MKIKNIPVYFILIISTLVSFLLGCGGGGSAPGVPNATGPSLAPTTLNNGATITLSGTYQYAIGANAAVLGDVHKVIVINSLTTATVNDARLQSAVSTPYTYSSPGVNVGQVTATNYPYAYLTPTVGTVTVTLTFTSATGGIYTEGTTGYTGSGTFVAYLP